MKKVLCVLCSVLVIATLFTACGSKTPTLSGKYSNETLLSESVYEFDKEGNVTYKLITSGYVAVNVTGTYAISEDVSEITLTFDESKTDLGTLLGSTTTLSGTFTFEQGEGYIQIGNVQYSKETAEK